MLIATIDTLLYHALVAGMLVSGLVVSDSLTECRTRLTSIWPFLVSPRDSPAAILNMIRKTCCSCMYSHGAQDAPSVDGCHSTGGAGIGVDYR